MEEVLKPRLARSASVTNWIQVAVAFSVLVLGTLVDVLDRPGESVPFFNAVSPARMFPSMFGRIGVRLPTLKQADSYFVADTFDAWDLPSLRLGPRPPTSSSGARHRRQGSLAKSNPHTAHRLGQVGLIPLIALGLSTTLATGGVGGGGSGNGAQPLSSNADLTDLVVATERFTRSRPGR